jgi:uncharacterized protein
MVRRLERRDQQRLATFLREGLPFSFPILGDVERTGVRGQGEEELWGWFSENELRAVLEHTPSSACVWGEDDSAVEELTGVLLGFGDLVELDGRFETVAPYTGRIPFGASHRQYMSYLQPLTFAPHRAAELEVSRATLADAEPIAALWCRSLTAEQRSRTADALRSRLASATDRIYVARNNRILVSTASTGQESPSLAVIRCAYTDPDLRERGWATASLSALCRDLLAEGKTVVVLTETLADARIYRKVGFVPAGLWVEWKKRPAR